MTLELNEQIKLLRGCERIHSSVAEELAKRGIPFDALQYRDGAPRKYGGGYDPLPSKPRSKDAIPAVSFFAGAGGMDLGLEFAGFKTLIAYEYEALFTATLKRNFPDMKVFGPPFHAGDVSKVDEVIASLESSGIARGFDGLFHGGPPCQPFSIAANQRFSKKGVDFKRTGYDSPKGTLVLDFVRIILHFMPRWVLIENVPGLADIDGGVQLANVVAALEGAGYFVTQPRIVNAKFLGVPQERKRLFLIATRSFQLLPALTQLPLVTVSSALSADLSSSSGHLIRDHRASSLLRYMELAYGQRDHLGRVDRLDPFAPSKTVIAGGRNGGGRSHLHPYVPRTLSPRECARLQTFPDWFEFEGSGARQFTQIGNAVPPRLAYEMGLLLQP